MISFDLNKAASSYSVANINLLNELFYKKADKTLIEELPNLFVSLELFHEALFKKIIKEVDKDPIRVKELASGSRLGLWESFIQLNERRKWEIVLTDFNEEVLPDIKPLKNSYFKFHTQVQNLFDDFQFLESKQRFDVIFSAYAFDNVWLPGDVQLIKEGNDWFISEILLDLSQSTLQKIKSDISLDKDFFRDVEVKQRKKPVEISKILYGDLLEEYYYGIENVEFNFPGGLIDKIKESFNKQLKKDGFFITADIAVNKKDESAEAYDTVNDCIKIKREDYGLAKYILEDLGYPVELKSLYEFIRDEEIETPVEIYDHFVFFVKRT